MLAVLIDRFIASGESSPRHMAGTAAARRKGVGGNGAAGERNRRGMMLSASWGAVMSRTGEINRFRGDGFPVHPSPGGGAAAAPSGGGRSQQRSSRQKRRHG